MALSSKIYDLNFKKLVNVVTPALTFNPVVRAWLYACVVPLNYVYGLFSKFKKSIEYRLTITPQVCHLEKALNDRYDFAQRRIYIIDAREYEALPLYLIVENKHMVLPLKTENHKVLYTKGETSIYTVDFMVMVPAVIGFDMVEMKAVVNSYKLLSKKFQINIF